MNENALYIFLIIFLTSSCTPKKGIDEKAGQEIYKSQADIVGGPIEFIMAACSNYTSFYSKENTVKHGKPLSIEDKQPGFPAHETISKMQPDFWIANGDNVYYDRPVEPRATTQEELRKKLHQMFSRPHIQNLLEQVPTYWMKDDHDHRYDDSDTTNNHKRYGSIPSHSLGVKHFSRAGTRC